MLLIAVSIINSFHNAELTLSICPMESFKISQEELDPELGSHLF